MKKELKDSLHLYLGCEALIEGYTNRKHPFNYRGIINYQLLLESGQHYSSVKAIKPILRPFSDIEIKEVFECEEVMWDGFYPAYTGNKTEFLKAFISKEHNYRLTFETYIKAANWLRKHSFDCDGLIESGLAVNAAELKSVSSR